MLSGGHEIPQKFLQIKQEDKFFSRLLSKESSKESFRVLYYGGASGAVPFMWESQPGTPKHPFCNSSLPPLTPPPSYQSNSPKTKSFQKSNSKPNFLFKVFPRITPKKSTHVSPSLSSSSISSSCSSNSFSSPSTPMMNFHRRWWLPRSRSTVRFGVDHDQEEEEYDEEKQGTTLCFGVRSHNGFSKDYFKGTRSKVNTKYPL